MKSDGDVKWAQPGESTDEGPRMLSIGGEAILVASPLMVGLHNRVKQIAVYPVPVLLQGETGSGKEWLARALHFEGARAEGPFRAINCGSIPQSLLESVFFGAERGAFTGAQATARGVFEQADGGTVFLDELGELPLAAQAALLRVLDGQSFTRIGGSRELRPQVRVVAATNRDLEARVRSGEFREDLYYRLSTLVLRVPPLRERRQEVVPLSVFFMRRASAQFGQAVRMIAPRARECLEDFHWPGNVRQLRNVIDAAVVRSNGHVLGIQDLDLPPMGQPVEHGSVVIDPNGIDYRQRVRAYEQSLIVAALRQTNGNQARAAQLLGLPRRTFFHKLSRYGIRRSIAVEPPARRGVFN